MIEVNRKLLTTANAFEGEVPPISKVIPTVKPIYGYYKYHDQVRNSSIVVSN